MCEIPARANDSRTSESSHSFRARMSAEATGQVSGKSRRIQVSTRPRRRARAREARKPSGSMPTCTSSRTRTPAKRGLWTSRRWERCQRAAAVTGCPAAGNTAALELGGRQITRTSPRHPRPSTKRKGRAPCPGVPGRAGGAGAVWNHPDTRPSAAVWRRACVRSAPARIAVATARWIRPGAGGRIRPESTGRRNGRTRSARGVREGTWERGEAKIVTATLPRTKARARNATGGSRSLTEDRGAARKQPDSV